MMTRKACCWPMAAAWMKWWSLAMSDRCGGSSQAKCSPPEESECGEAKKYRSASGAGREKDLVETAEEAGQFSSLVAALKAAGLIETLKGKGPFTVFAPTDEAFERLPKSVLDQLLQDRGKLTSLLTYHVVPGRILSSDLKAIDSLRTVEGSPIKVDLSAGIQVGSAKVVRADIKTKNGVIHVIDSVLQSESAS